MIDHQLSPILIPSQDYANEWISTFRSAYPEFKNIARDIFLRLTGHPSWPAMVDTLRPNAPLFDFDNLTLEERLVRAAAIRRVLADEFGMRADVANHVAWTNPPGSTGFWALRTPEFSVRRQGSDQPVPPEEHAALDALNRGRCIETPEGQARLNARPQIGAHLGILKHLGWQFEVLSAPPVQMSHLGSTDQFYVEPVAFIADVDLGKVPVFVAGFTAHPGSAHDQVLVHYLSGALNAAELLCGPGAPALVLYATSTSRKHKDRFLTCFGAIVYDDVVKDLLLNHNCRTLSDVFVHLVATPLDSPQIADYADDHLSLQRMFERARQQHLISAAAPSKLYRIKGASGWSEMRLMQEDLTAR